jgi:chemotaxis protein CheC
MEPLPARGDDPLRPLEAILETAARSASHALSVWLGRRVEIAMTAVDEVDLVGASDLLGSADRLVAVCGMELKGWLTGELLVVFEDATGLALVDLLLRRPRGSSLAWGELERSAACETANIVGCALLNALAEQLPDEARDEPLVPSPPTFRHEFAGSLVEFALMNQAMLSDRVVLTRSRLTAVGDEDLSLWLLYVPGGPSFRALAGVLEGRQA